MSTSRVIIRFDGSYRSKRGTGSAGGHIILDGVEIATIHTEFKCESPVEAEYQALIHTLQKALELGLRSLHVEGDNQVVIRQMTNEIRCHDKKIKRLRGRARMLTSFCNKVSFNWIPRGENSRADELSKSRTD